MWVSGGQTYDKKKKKGKKWNWTEDKEGRREAVVEQWWTDWRRSSVGSVMRRSKPFAPQQRQSKVLLTSKGLREWHGLRKTGFTSRIGHTVMVPFLNSSRAVLNVMHFKKSVLVGCTDTNVCVCAFLKQEPSFLGFKPTFCGLWLHLLTSLSS